MKPSLSWALTLATLLSAPAQAEQARDAQIEAADYATCAAYYFNATNVLPMQEYERAYATGERAFNAGVKRVGRKQIDDLMARTSGEMMKLMGSDWKNFASVQKRYRADCDALMARTPE